MKEDDGDETSCSFLDSVHLNTMFIAGRPVLPSSSSLPLSIIMRPTIIITAMIIAIPSLVPWSSPLEHLHRDHHHHDHHLHDHHHPALEYLLHRSSPGSAPRPWQNSSPAHLVKISGNFFFPLQYLVWFFVVDVDETCVSIMMVVLGQYISYELKGY